MKRPLRYAIFMTLVLAMLLPQGLLAAPQEPGANPPTPNYVNNFGDCVTGDNQFYNSGIGKFRWYINQVVGADGSTSLYKCDSYQNDQYERPTSQTFVYGAISEKPPYSPPPTPSSPTYLSGLLPDAEFGVGTTVYSTDAGLYHEYVDITRAWAGYDDQWMYFRIELFGNYEVDSAASRTYKFGDGTYYTVRLGNVDAPPNQKANGGIALRNQWGTSQPSSWSSDPSSVKLFVDVDSDVSGYQGVNFTKDDGDAMPGNDGYDLDRENEEYLYVRKVTVPFTGPGGSVDRPAVEFAFNYAAYNQDFGANFTPFTLSYLEFDATRGLKDNQNYLWNDEYTLNEAGSPNPAAGGPNPGNLGQAGTSGTGNIYELDTLRGDGLFGLGSIGNCVWHDADRDGNGPQGCTKGPDFDNDEDPIPGIGVELFRRTGPFAFTSMGTLPTNANGYYLFTNLPAGSYVVDVLETGVLSYFGGPFVETTTEPYSYALALGENHRNADFGYDNDPGPVYVGDWVWYDINADGQQNDGILLYPSPNGDMYDTGIPCVEIRLYVGPDSNNLQWIGTTNTDGWGNYAFPLLIPNASGQKYFTGIGVGAFEDPDVSSFIDYYNDLTNDFTCVLASEWVDDGYLYTPTGAPSMLKNPAPDQATTPSLRDTSLPTAGGFDLRLDFGFSNQPLAATLANFGAAPQGDSVLITWETVSELDNAGFNLYRSLSANGDLSLVANLPSPTPGSTQGAAYSHQDFDVTAGQTYWYWLESVSLNGATTMYDPVSAALQSPTAVTVSELTAGSATTVSLGWLPIALVLAVGALGGLTWRRLVQPR